jgi:hypothetical protein
VAPRLVLHNFANAARAIRYLGTQTTQSVAVNGPAVTWAVKHSNVGRAHPTCLCERLAPGVAPFAGCRRLMPWRARFGCPRAALPLHPPWTIIGGGTEHALRAFNLARPSEARIRGLMRSRADTGTEVVLFLWLWRAIHACHPTVSEECTSAIHSYAR